MPLAKHCIATIKTTGEQCKNYPIKGATVCRNHGGSIQHVRSKAAVRYAVATWAAGDPTVDPGETLLRLMTVSLLRADQHRAELDRLVTRFGWERAFVGDKIVVSDDGRAHKVGEYVRQLATWEARERHEAADLAIKAVAAGLAERQVRVLEQQVIMFSQVLRAALVAAGLDTVKQAEVIAGVSSELRAIAS